MVGGGPTKICGTMLSDIYLAEPASFLSVFFFFFKKTSAENADAWERYVYVNKKMLDVKMPVSIFNDTCLVYEQVFFTLRLGIPNDATS